MLRHSWLYNIDIIHRETCKMYKFYDKKFKKCIFMWKLISLLDPSSLKSGHLKFFPVFSVTKFCILFIFKSAFLKGICHFLWNTDVLNLFSMNISMKMWTDGSISGHLTTKLHFWHQKRLLQNLGHFGFHPLPPDQNVLILNYKKIRFSSWPPPSF